MGDWLMKTIEVIANEYLHLRFKYIDCETVWKIIAVGFNCLVAQDITNKDNLNKLTMKEFKQYCEMVSGFIDAKE
jgi:hypothetical protein